MPKTEFFDALDEEVSPAEPPWGVVSSEEDLPTPPDPDKTTDESGDIEKSELGISYGEKPSWGWDYVFTFKLPKSLKRKLQREEGPENQDETPREEGQNADQGDDDQKSQERIRKRTEILSRLRSAGFHFSQLLIPSENVILLRFSLPEEQLKRKAEEIGMELRLKEEYGSGYLAFIEEREDVFSNAEDGKARECYFGPSDRALIVIKVLQSRDHWGCDLNIEQLLHEETLLQAFALHSKQEHDELIYDAVWARLWDPTWKPPLQNLKDYLGARVAFYFVFVSFYARRLLAIAILSIPVYITYRVVRNLLVITILRWIFSVALVLWTTFFLENWKRRNASTNIKWGLNDFHEDTADDTRVQFVGETRYGFYCKGGFVPLEDVVAEREEQGEEGAPLVDTKGEALLLPRNPWQDPQQARNAQLTSLGITALFVVLVGSLTFLLLWFRNDITKAFEERTAFASAVPGILNAILITVFDSIWRVVSLWLTRRENHRTNQKFENSLIYKRFAFQFVSNYVSLFYIAFIRPYLKNTCPVGPTNDPDCMLELETQLTSLVITKATIGQIVEIVVPYITSRLKQWQARRRSSQNATPEADSPNVRENYNASSAHNRYIEESKLVKYTSTMEDYAELVIQFGYLALFGLAFPLASVVNLVNNLIEVRTDAFKILVLSQRVDADDAADIGAWYPILEFLNVVAVATNVGLLVFTADSVNVIWDLDRRLGDDDGTKMLYKVVCFFVVEHLLLGLKGLAAGLIKDVSSRTHRVVARQLYDIARWFGEGWQDGFRGKSLLKVDEALDGKSGRLAEHFDLASEDGDKHKAKKE